MSLLDPSPPQEELPTADGIKTGTVLIREGALLPGAMRFDSESCMPVADSLKREKRQAPQKEN
jgi:hypothetical protein